MTSRWRWRPVVSVAVAALCVWSLLGCHQRHHWHHRRDANCQVKPISVVCCSARVVVTRSSFRPDDLTGDSLECWRGDAPPLLQPDSCADWDHKRRKCALGRRSVTHVLAPCWLPLCESPDSVESIMTYWNSTSRARRRALREPWHLSVITVVYSPAV